MKKNMPIRLALHKGQSLVEVIIALAFATIIIIALVTITIKSIRSATFARNNSQATKFAQEGLEWIRSQRDQMDWNSFISNVKDGTYCINNLNWLTPSSCGTDLINNLFQRTVIFIETDTAECYGGVGATVNVAWNDSTGTHTSNQKTCFSNWQEK